MDSSREQVVMSSAKPIELDFSHKYDREHARQYLQKHQDGLARRLSHWRDEQLARHALKVAGEPNLLLDLPCGAGRFWPLLAEQPNRVILAARQFGGQAAAAPARATGGGGGQGKPLSAPGLPPRGGGKRGRQFFLPAPAASPPRHGPRIGGPRG